MGVGVCYVSVTNITKRKEQRPSWEADGRARIIHSNPPHTIPWRCITLHLLKTLIFPIDLRPARAPTKSHHAFLSVSTDVSLLTKSVHYVSFPRAIQYKANNHTHKYSPFIAHSTAFQVSRLYSSNAAFVQNCQWSDIPVTLVHMKVVKWNPQWNWERGIFADTFALIMVSKKGGCFSTISLQLYQLRH